VSPLLTVGDTKSNYFIYLFWNDQNVFYGYVFSSLRRTKNWEIC